jgi:coproporphyrinogen III oxidase-like Fe-S oxidoreductase
MIEADLAVLPEVAPDKPLEQWSTAELLNDTTRLALLQLRAIITQEFDPDDLKKQRLIGDFSLGVGRLSARVQEASMRKEAFDRWPELLAKVEAAKRGELPAPVETEK